MGKKPDVIEGDGDPEQLLRTVLEAAAALSDLRTTEGVIDLSIVLPGETVYRVPDATGEVREYTIPNDLPFTTGLAFLTARDEFVKAEAALGPAAGKRAGRALRTYEDSWRRLIEVIHQLVALRRPDVTIQELDSIGQGQIRNWVGALCMQLLADRIRPFASSPSPKAPANRAARRRVRRAQPA